jgi:nicotinamide mononucleotide transporter
MFASVLNAVYAMSIWELAAVVLAITYLLLAVRENIWCWAFAFVSTAIYTVLFFDVSLLMDSALNVYYMVMAVYGWYQWSGGGSGADADQTKQALPIKTMSGQQHVLVLVIIAVLTLTSGYLLSENTAAAWPYVDSFTTWASVISTWLVARKYLENWLYWIVIDSVSVPLYIERGLSLTAMLFVAYVVIATIGYFSWKAQTLRHIDGINN